MKMKNTSLIKKLFALGLSLSLILSMAACGQQAQEQEAAEETAAVTETAVDTTETETVITTADVTSGGAIDASDIFSKRDLTQTADLSEAEYLTLSDGQDISITTAGVYVITGNASDVTIVVDAGDEDKVQIVLNEVSITNSDSPAIYVKNADKVFVTTTETENTLKVTGEFTADGDTNIDAVIFSKDDLVLNGLGTLNIVSTDNGVTSKDDLKITGGTFNITTESDALEANDSIAIADGNITISSGKDGMHAENDEDDTLGYIYICGGSFDIDAADDGIQATTILQIDGGEFGITSAEGLEATHIQINGGTIDINAADDGINGSVKSTAISVEVEINGGNITVSMGQGDTDAIDSNGALTITGGTIDITAQSPFDFDGAVTFTGGTVTVNGQAVTQITNQMMGGGMPGGMPGGFGGGPGGDPGGFGGPGFGG